MIVTLFFPQDKQAKLHGSPRNTHFWVLNSIFLFVDVFSTVNLNYCLSFKHLYLSILIIWVVYDFKTRMKYVKSHFHLNALLKKKILNHLSPSYQNYS